MLPEPDPDAQVKVPLAAGVPVPLIITRVLVALADKTVYVCAEFV
jgi:hypothetical protein